MAPSKPIIKLISWNLNGIRAVQKKELFYSFIKQSEADVFCFQETKAKPEQVDIAAPAPNHQHWHSAEKAGYSGTLTLSQLEPQSVKRGLGGLMEDKEGRVLTTEFDRFFLVNVYTPNAKRDLARLPYRQEWDQAFLSYLKELEKIKPVITCGDFNVSHKEIDLANPKSNKKNAGFTAEEREGFDRFVENGLIDSFRIFNQDSGQYTWWSYRNQARERNIGWRLDYFLVSESIKEYVVGAEIHPNFLGSDHCPVSLTLDFSS